MTLRWWYVDDVCVCVSCVCAYKSCVLQARVQVCVNVCARAHVRVCMCVFLDMCVYVCAFTCCLFAHHQIKPLFSHPCCVTVTSQGQLRMTVRHHQGVPQMSSLIVEAVLVYGVGPVSHVTTSNLQHGTVSLIHTYQASQKVGHTQITSDLPCLA